MRRVPESARPTGPGMGCALLLAAVFAIFLCIVVAVIVSVVT